MKTVLIIGATSAIAEATARRYAKRGDRLYLVARNEERLKTLARDLKIRGAADVVSEVLDVNDFERHAYVIKQAFEQWKVIDIVLLAHGYLPNQSACEKDFLKVQEVMNTNALSVMSLLTLLSGEFEKQACGTIAVISSVAGDRGRSANYVYGAAKSAVTAFLQGLRARLLDHGVHVLTIKPGPVDTPMSVGREKNMLWGTAESVGRGIVRAIEAKKDVVYLPWFWHWIMMVIRVLPESLFKRVF